MKLIDKAAVVTEIERRIVLLENNSNGIISTLASGILVDDYKDLLSFLDTLEVKEIDLEKEYEEFVVDDPILGNFITNDTMGMVIAKHFYELGLKVNKGE